MRRIPRAWLAAWILLIPALGRGQEVPEFTPERQQLITELFGACLKDGGLKLTTAGKQQSVQVADRDRLRATLAARRDRLGPPMRDALLAFWRMAHRDSTQAIVTVLDLLGQEKKDDSARGLAAFLTARGLEQEGQLKEAAGGYRSAVTLFDKAGMRDWQAFSLHNLGFVLEDQGSPEPTLGYHKQALEIRRRLYPDSRYPDGHADLAVSLNNLGLALASQGSYADAAGHHNQALAMRRKLYPAARFPDGHPDLALSLSNLGMAHKDQGLHGEALDCCRQALAMRRKFYPAERFPNGHVNLATSLNNLGSVLEVQGTYDEAQDCYKQAHEMRGKLYPPSQFPDGHPHLALSLSNLGSVSVKQGLHAEALDFCRQALAMRRKLYPVSDYPAGHIDLAQSLHNLGAVFQAQGSYAEAIRHYRQALAVCQKLYPPARFPDGHPQLAHSLNILGSLFQEQGSYAEALGYYQQALDMRRKLYPPSRYPDGHPDLATSLNNLGGVFGARDLYKEALVCHKQSLEMKRKLYSAQRYPDGHPDLATSLNNLAFVFQEVGSYREAVDQFRQALEVYRKLYPAARYPNGHPDLPSVLNNLGAVCSLQGDHTEAIRYHKQALEVYRKLYPAARYPNGHPHLARSLNNLGSALQDQGSIAEALQAYTDAVQALRAVNRPIDLEAGPGAAPLLRPQPDTVTLLRNRALLLEETLPARAPADRLRAAERAHALAAAVHDRLRGQVLRKEADKLLHGEVADLTLPHRLSLLARLFQVESKPSHLIAAFEALEQGRARVFLESLGEAHAADLAGLPDGLRRRERELSLRLREIGARIERLLGQPGDEPARLVRQLYADRLKAEEEQKAFVDGLQRTHPQYAGFRYPGPCKLEQARDCLGDNEVALLFTVGEDASWVLVLEKKARAEDKGQGLALFPLAGAKELDLLLDTLLAPQTLQRPVLARPAADKLSRKVFGSIADRIAGKDLLIMADGELGLLPFELLREDGQWLVEKHKIRYAPSLSALHLSRQHKRQATPTPLWALADPIFDRGDVRARGLPAPKADLRLALLRSGCERLLASGPEVEAICDALGVPTKGMLRDGDAKEAQVKEASRSGEMAKARFVHFATHGELGKDKTPQPRLVLGQVGNDDKEEMGGPNDGYLTLPEVTFLKLNAQAVVLSACETGKGRRDRGEGVSGLARTFLFAGSKAVVCSLWSVDDARTAELMSDFYKGLKDEKPTGEALRAAQLKMIRAGRAPFFWAPFVLMGE